MDLLVLSHVSPQFNFHIVNGSGKSFAMVDGTLSTISIKSSLDSKEINDTLLNMASIPDKTITSGMMNPYLPIHDYEDWPLKVIFAFDGVSIDTAHNAVYSFYENNPEIPVSKRPNIIHVLGKYFAVKTKENTTLDGKPLPKDQYYFTEHDNPDVFAFFYVISEIQKHAWLSQHISFRFWDELNKFVYPDMDKFSQ
jgi:hypothetical protein